MTKAINYISWRKDNGAHVGTTIKNGNHLQGLNAMLSEHCEAEFTIDSLKYNSWLSCYELSLSIPSNEDNGMTTLFGELTTIYR